MTLSEIEKMYKNDPVAFTLWLNEAKNKATKEGDIARALIHNNTAKKLAEKYAISINKSDNYSSKTNDRICICSPTTHVGSFRCKYHRSIASSLNCSPNPTNLAKTQPKEINKSFNGLNSVRTISASGQAKLSRFGRPTCEDMTLIVK